MAAFWLSLGVFVVMLLGLVRLHWGLKKMHFLSDVSDSIDGPAPRVSLIFSALNEAATIEPALRSVLAVDYPDLEVVAVDDRSTDATGEILDRLARTDPRLRVLHITELPAGWLGKCHALWKGAQVATGDYLIFTDADVVFEPRALRRAVAYSQAHQLGHLVVLAEFIVKEHLLASLLMNFLSFGFAIHPPWQVRTSPAVYIGMGAFNMVRADAYAKAGGHASLKLEIIDDIMLGKRMKAAGFTQDVLFGRDAVSLEWYRDAGELTRGLEKNSYAMLEYQPWRLAAPTIAVALARYWPIAALFFTSGVTWWLNLGTIVVTFLWHLEVFRLMRWNRRCFLWWPFAAAIMLWILWRAVILTIRRGGVNWRGTLYSLEELKRGHVG